MSDTQIPAKNSPPALQALYAEKRLSWWPVILFLPARFIFALAAQGLTAGILALQGSSDAWGQAAGWWLVSSNLADILCLLALAWLTRREGLTFIDLVGVWGKPALRQLAWTPLYLLAMLPAVAAGTVITRTFYGSAPSAMFTLVNLPPAAAWYGLIVWPVIWVIAKE